MPDQTPPRLRFDGTLNWNTIILVIGFIGTGATAYFTLKANDVVVDQRLIQHAVDLKRLQDNQDVLRQQLTLLVSAETSRAHQRMTEMERRAENNAARIDAELIRLRDKLDTKMDRVRGKLGDPKDG